MNLAGEQNWDPDVVQPFFSHWAGEIPYFFADPERNTLWELKKQLTAVTLARCHSGHVKVYTSTALGEHSRLSRRRTNVPHERIVTFYPSMYLWTHYLVDWQWQALKIHLKNPENYFCIDLAQDQQDLRAFCRDIRNGSWHIRKVNGDFRYPVSCSDFGSNPSNVFYPVTGKALRWFFSFRRMEEIILSHCYYRCIRCLVCVQSGVFKGKYFCEVFSVL